MVKPFHSEARRKLLHYFYTHEEAKHYLREIATMLEVDPGNLSRELRKLEIEGVFQSKKRGNQKCFFLNPPYAHFSELKALFTNSPDNPEGIDPVF